jgi:uncharacterized cupin superfamily protein
MMNQATIRMNASDLDRPTDGPEPAEGGYEGDPIETAHVYYDQDGVSSGVWICTPGKTLNNDYPCDEFCTIIGGKVGIVNNDDNSEEVYSAGDSFFVPKGANTTWIIYETVSKFWMITER